ncbi:MAG TPA: hypothetical protein VGB55_10895, partial [Tepidisphaeraceae bacterium]
NPHDFFACPAFHKHAQNMFVIRSTVDANVAIKPDGFHALDEHSKLTGQLFSFLHPTRKKYRSILFDHRMLFYCEESVQLSTYPAYMHASEVQSKLVYVPAAYDISKWLRPLQGTYEVLETTPGVRIREDDPLYYVKFDTTEKVRLRRFQMVPELNGIAHGCVHYKLFRPQQSLEKVYNAFTQSKLQGRVAKLIKDNLLE